MTVHKCETLTLRHYFSKKSEHSDAIGLGHSRVTTSLKFQLARYLFNTRDDGEVAKISSAIDRLIKEVN